jgi:hypothetical protein
VNQLIAQTNLSYFDSTSESYICPVVPIENSYYKGTFNIKFKLSKRAIASEFTKGLSSSDPILFVYRFIAKSDWYFASDALQNYCQQNNVNVSDITNYGYSLTHQTLSDGTPA